MPLQKDETRPTGFFLFRRVWRDHLAENRKSIMLCVFIVVICSLSPFVTAFYARVVVDDVLGIQTAVSSDVEHESARRSDRISAPSRAPERGLERSLEQGPLPVSRPPAAGRRLFGMAALWILTAVVINILHRVLHLIKIRTERVLTGSLREALHRKVLELSLAYHKVQTAGRLLSRITSDVEQVQNQIMQLLHDFLYVYKITHSEI